MLQQLPLLEGPQQLVHELSAVTLEALHLLVLRVAVGPVAWAAPPADLALLVSGHEVLFGLLCCQSIGLHQERAEQRTSTPVATPAVHVDRAACTQTIHDCRHRQGQPVSRCDRAIRNLALQELQLGVPRLVRCIMFE
eukprot:UN3831